MQPSTVLAFTQDVRRWNTAMPPSLEYAWKGVGGGTGYSECRFPNDKVGHAVGHPQPKPGSTRFIFAFWRGSLDGITVGQAPSEEDAKALVEMAYKEKYGA